MKQTEIIRCLINGTIYASSAGAVVRECRELFGEVSRFALERYGVIVEADRAALVEATRGGFSDEDTWDWAKIPARKAGW